MTQLLKSLMVLGLCQAVVATSGAAETFNKQEFLKEGVSMTQNSLQSLMKDLSLADSRSCPSGGTEFVENIRQEKGKIFSFMDRVDDVRDSVKPALRERQADSQRCGSCKQTNVVSLVTSVSPEETRFTPECTNRPAETLSVNLESKSSIKDFIGNVLQGRNSEGKRLYKACPDPCAFYVTSAETDLPDGRALLTLTVQCGQPRKSSIFSAKYDFQSGLIHQWTCSK